MNRYWIPEETLLSRLPTIRTKISKDLEEKHFIHDLKAIHGYVRWIRKG